MTAVPAAAPAPDCVALTRLSVQDFRNYASLRLELDSGLIVLTGANGVGKTNLLEAISLLTPGRGLRRAAFEEITRFGSGGGWAVAATLVRNGEAARIGTGTAGEADASGERSRKVRVNGAPASGPDALLDFLRVLWLTPSMDGLFTGPAADRRRFLDRLVLTVDPRHGGRARDLERLLTHRNRLLENGAAAGWLDAVEAELSGTAVAVALARAETVALLSARITSAPAALEFPAGRLALAGDFDRAVSERTAAAAEAWYRESLLANRGVDRFAGRTLLGPHRSDLDVLFAEKEIPAARSSTGEQKALLIGLILAHAELAAGVSGMTPVLLLDEVAAHLDPARRRALFARLSGLRCQSFLTGADPALFTEAPAGAARYRVAGGRVVEEGT